MAHFSPKKPKKKNFKKRGGGGRHPLREKPKTIQNLTHMKM
jgi:hypothetical protein